jgi:small subunit ribosomal protein S4
MSSARRSRKQVRESRALGLALTPKAVKYFDKRPYPPGEHGRGRRRTESDYAIRLREKQISRAFQDARKDSGLTGEALVELLEVRLDSLVLRSGFARTIYQARQVVVHRHVLVDGKLVDRPSFRVKPGQVIMIKPKSQPLTPFQVAAAGAHRDAQVWQIPEYLDVNLERLRAQLVRRPKRAEVPVTCDVQLVVEHYSR